MPAGRDRNSQTAPLLIPGIVSAIRAPYVRPSGRQANASGIDALFSLRTDNISGVAISLRIALSFHICFIQYRLQYKESQGI